jgi:hypothetical protein
MTCRYDRESGEYLDPNGSPCLTDDYGDPTRHCTARRTCSQHIGRGELTCARCIGRVRANLRRIITLAAFADRLLPTVASVDSELVNLAGPGADPRLWSARRRHAQARLFAAWRAGDITEAQLDRAYEAIEDDDELHPVNLLTRWEMMLREDYDQPTTRRATLHAAAAYLEVVLPRMAQDPEQDFGLLASDLRKCRNHLELAESLALHPRRGAPCPACIDEGSEKAPRLRLEPGHWCEREDCTRQHWPEAPDMWHCPRNRSHEWTDEDYRTRVADVYAEQTTG